MRTSAKIVPENIVQFQARLRGHVPGWKIRSFHGSCGGKILKQWREPAFDKNYFQGVKEFYHFSTCPKGTIDIAARYSSTPNMPVCSAIDNLECTSTPDNMPAYQLSCPVGFQVVSSNLDRFFSYETEDYIFFNAGLDIVNAPRHFYRCCKCPTGFTSIRCDTPNCTQTISWRFDNPETMSCPKRLLCCHQKNKFLPRK